MYVRIWTSEASEVGVSPPNEWSGSKKEEEEEEGHGLAKEESSVVMLRARMPSGAAFRVIPNFAANPTLPVLGVGFGNAGR